MSWEWIEAKHKFRDKKGWDKAKGLLAKMKIGKTGLTEKMTEIDNAFKTIDARRFRYFMSNKDVETAVQCGTRFEAVRKELKKLDDLKPKIAELSKRATTLKTDHGKNLPFDAKDFLDKLISECASYPKIIADARTLEEANYRKYLLIKKSDMEDQVAADKEKQRRLEAMEQQKEQMKNHREAAAHSTPQRGPHGPTTGHNN